ncbi:hypothetical protein MMC34_006073 [Xylographa carneopallida]|nr:hypothetical protein [Xylographa carneopallida]
MRVLAYDNSPAAMYPRIQCTPGEHAPSPSLKHGACPCAGSEHQHFDPPVPRTHHELQWHAHETQNCCSHNHVPRQQLVQQRPLTAKAQGKQRVRFLCHEPTCAESAVVAATSMAAALLVMHQLRLLGDLLARFQVLDAACVASLGCGVNSKSCLQVWRRLHRPYTDRIVAVLQAIERITEAHRLLYSSGFRSGVEDWWTPDVYRPRLRVSHLLAPKENVEDKKRRDNRSRI